MDWVDTIRVKSEEIGRASNRQLSAKQSMRQMETKTWCVEWFGSQGDFLAEGKRQSIPLARLQV